MYQRAVSFNIETRWKYYLDLIEILTNLGRTLDKFLIDDAEEIFCHDITLGK